MTRSPRRTRTTSRASGAFTDVLSSFAVIAVIVGGFVIYNTFSILVAQRGSRAALLRALGAHRQPGPQRPVLGEAARPRPGRSVSGSASGFLLALGRGPAPNGRRRRSRQPAGDLGPNHRGRADLGFTTTCSSSLPGPARRHGPAGRSLRGPATDDPGTPGKRTWSACRHRPRRAFLALGLFGSTIMAWLPSASALCWSSSASRARAGVRPAGHPA